MINIEVEDDLDFFSELKKELSNLTFDTNKNDENFCLLSKQPLNDNYITLECGHKFNYESLYKEVLQQKISNPLEVTYVNINEIKCPYCREISVGLLPYIPIYDLPIKRGINFPEKYCKKIYECEWVLKSGKSAGNTCCKSAYIVNGMKYCQQHHFLQKKLYMNKKHINNMIPIEDIEWTEHHTNMSKKYNIIQLKELLKQHKYAVSGNKKNLIKRLVFLQIL